MIRYIDGSIAAVGDTVLIDKGERTGLVVEVIEGNALLRRWGVDEPGLMVESDYYGLLFIPADRISDMGCKPASGTHNRDKFT